MYNLSFFLGQNHLPCKSKVVASKKFLQILYDAYMIRICKNNFLVLKMCGMHFAYTINFSQIELVKTITIMMTPFNIIIIQRQSKQTVMIYRIAFSLLE